MILNTKINNKLTSSFLASLVMLSGVGVSVSNNVSAATTVLNNQKSDKSTQEVDFFTKQQVIEDIDYVMSTIKKIHVGCVHEIPKEVLNQRNIEIQNLSESTSIVEEWRIISRILAKLHDAHTQIFPPEILYKKYIPLIIRGEGNKFFCKSGEFKDAEIIEINGLKISDIYENFKDNFSYEIEEWPHLHFFEFPACFTQFNLARAGVDIFKPVEITFKTDDGVKIQKFEFVNVVPKVKKNVPFVSYKIDKENSTGIFTLNSCDFNHEYCNTVDKFFAEVASNNIKNVIVDLRRNVGGNSDVSNYFAKYMKNLKNIKTHKNEIRTGDKIYVEKLTYTQEYLKNFQAKKNLFDGKVYILTSNMTFSSAMLFARDFSDNRLATIVGEVPGNSPTCFGSVFNQKCFTPNSKLIFKTTYKKFYRTDSTKDPNRLIPDIAVSAKESLSEVYKIIQKNM